MLMTPQLDFPQSSLASSQLSVITDHVWSVENHGVKFSIRADFKTICSCTNLFEDSSSLNQ
jgi:hypothetical protein